jgi:phage tail protein X
MEEYTTVSGDTFDLVAYKVYGDETRAVELIDANLEHVDIVIFTEGISIKVPPIENSKRVSDLPPWKQGGF